MIPWKPEPKSELDGAEEEEEEAAAAEEEEAVVDGAAAVVETASVGAAFSLVTSETGEAAAVAAAGMWLESKAKVMEAPAKVIGALPLTTTVEVIRLVTYSTSLLLSLWP